MSEVYFKLSGVDELKAALAAAKQKIRTKAVRGALRMAASLIRDEARRLAPVLDPGAYPSPPKYRTPGTVKKRIVVRASKYARADGNEGVFVSVKPLRGKADTRRYGKASAKNPHDPYYWRFLEFKTKRNGGQRSFMTPAVEAKGEAAIKRFMAEVVPKIEKLNEKAGR